MARPRYLLSVKDAASQLGLKPVTVRAHVARGNLKAQKLAGALWIEHDELQRFARERRLPGHSGTRKSARWDAVRSQPVRSQPVQLETSSEASALAPHEGAAPENRELVAQGYLAEASECAPERKSF